MSHSDSHSCTICGAPTRDALCGNRLLLGSDIHHLPTEDTPSVSWRCATHQRYEMRQASGVHVSERGDLISTLTCGHEVCWVFRGRHAYTPATIKHAITTRQIRLDQPQRCYLCGDLERESESAVSHERLAALIQAHQGALLAHPEAQATHEAMINLLQGVDTGEITLGQCVRLLH